MYPVIAICGKSASGKDTFSKYLSTVLNQKNVNNNIIISDTTRPIRHGEKDGVSYHFITEDDFFYKIRNDKFLEFSEFRKWYYGTSIDSLVENEWNIGVFNADGIKFLEKHNRDIGLVIYIYLYANPITRLRRSYKREHKWKLEYFRRMFADWKDFRRFKHLIRDQRYGIIIKNETDETQENMLRMVNNVLTKMFEWKLL